MGYAVPSPCMTPDNPMTMPCPAPLFAQFVYYRVPHANRRSAAVAVQQMQAALVRQWPGLQARLMHRADVSQHGETANPPEAEETWMETYEHPSGISPSIAQAIAAQAGALPSGLIGVRHVETFVPLTTPLTTHTA